MQTKYPSRTGTFGKSRLLKAFLCLGAALALSASANAAITQDIAATHIAWAATNGITIVNGTPTTWGLVADSTSSGGLVLEEQGASDTANTASTAEWTLVFKTAGTYQLYIKYRLSPCCGGNSYKFPDSFSATPVYLVSKANENGAGPTSYTVLKEQVQNGGALATFTVSQADVDNVTPLTFKIGTREAAGMRFDRIMLSTDTTLDTANGAGFNALPNSGAGLSFTVQPADTALDVGQNASFAATVAGGTSPYTYLWYTNGIADAVSGLNPTYSLNGVTNADNGRTFQLVVTDAGSISITSRLATLTINPIHFVSDLADVTVPFSQTATLSATVVSGAAPYTYQWITNGIVDPSVTAANYSLTNVGTAENGRTFRVIVTDSTSISITSRVATLTVLEAAGRIGVSFTGRIADNTPAPLVNPGDVAGLLPQGNWNNINNSSTFGGASGAFNDGNGAATTVTLTYDANDSWHNDGATGTPNEKLMKGISKAGGANRKNVYTFNNVPAGLYDLIVYLNVNGDNRIGDISCAGVTYYYTSQHQFGGTFLQIQNQNPAGPRDLGNYVKFRVLANAANQIPMTFINRDANDGIGLSGFQLVPLAPQLAISSQPSDVSKYVGQSANFSASAVFGTTPYTYQWYTNGVADTVSGLSSSYSIGGTTVVDSGRTFQLVVTDATSLSVTTRVARLIKVLPNRDISLNFVGRNAGGYRITPLLTAGVVPRTNWNNNVASGEMPTSGDSPALNDDANNATPVTVHWESTDGWDNNTDFNNPDGNYKMMKGEYKVANGQAGLIVFNNLPPESAFDFYAYTAVNNGGALPGNVQLSLWVTNQANPGSGTISITNYSREPDNYGGTFVLAENFNPAASFPGGNYVRITNVFSAANGTLFLGVKHIAGGDGAGITGIQLIRRADMSVAPMALVSGSVTQAPNPAFEGSPFTLGGFSASGIGPRTYQWQTNTAHDGSGTWVNVAGANGATFTGIPFFSESGTQYRLIVANSLNSLTSAPVAIQVVQDVTSPTLVSALGGANRTSIYLTFSEPMRVQDATNLANYVVTNSAGGSLSVTGGVVLVDGKTVVLGTAFQAGGAQYGIVITGIRDRAFNLNTITPNPTVATFTSYDLDYLPGQVLFRAYNVGAGNAIAQLTGNPLYPNTPDYSQLINAMNSRGANDPANPGFYTGNTREAFGGTIAGHFIPPASGNWIFYVSSDDDGQLVMNTNGPSASGASIVRFAPGCCRALANGADPTPPISLIAGQAYYIEAQYKEGTGGDYVEIGARLQGSTAPIVPIPASQLAYLTKMAITQPLADINVEEAHVGVFSVGVSVGGAGGVRYQWARSTDTSGTTFTNLPGATGSTLAVGPVFGVNDNGFKFRVVVSNPITSFTNIATLNVIPDLAAPRLVSASVDNALRQVLLTFNEAMNTNADAFLADPLSYTFLDAQSNQLNLDFSGAITSSSNVLFTLVPGQLLDNTVYGIANLCCISDANSNALDFNYSIAMFRTPTYSRGFAKYDFYMGFGGTTIPALLALPIYPNSPSLTYYTNNLDFPQTVVVGSPNGLDNYGLRMSGFFVPPVTGNYTFWFKNDDDARFSISTDESPANLVTVRDSACCSGNFWNPATVTNLVAGRRYYFEGLVKEGGGGDYLTIGVNEPGSSTTNAITGKYIEAAVTTNFAPNAGISQQPVNATVEENHVAVFTVGVTNTGNYAPFVQWQTNFGTGFGDFPGAIGTTVTTPPLPLAANGIQIRAKVYLPGLTLISTPATIFVTADTNKPLALSAASANGTQIGVRFSELLSSGTATDTNNYAVNGERPLSATVRPEGSNVVLIVATPVGKEFTVVVSNLTDIASTPNVVSNTTLLGKYWIDTVVDIGNPTPAGVHFSGKEGQIEVAAGGADVWGTSDQFTYAYSSRTNDFDVKVRVDAVQYIGNNWTKAGINARSSTDTNASMVWFYPTPPEGGSHTYEGAIRYTNGVNIGADFQPRPNVVLPSWLRLVRNGSVFSPYISTNGINWDLFGTNAPYAAPDLPAVLLVGLGTVSHVDGTAATAKYAEFGDTHPTLSLQVIGTNLVIRWDGTGELQYTDNLPAAWIPLPAAKSPYTVPMDQAHRYYQVRRLFPNQ